MKTFVALSALATVAMVSAVDCPPPGTSNANGVSCDPAVQYPGEACAVMSDGCYYLRGLGLLTSGTASSAHPTTTASCPPPGTTNANGESCNPAVEHPGQACALIDGCYYLRGLGLLTSVPSATATAHPTATTCPPPGATDAAGDYSCNPAHQYPNQVCVLIGDCYFLRGLGLLTSVTGSASAHMSSGTHAPPTHVSTGSPAYSPTQTVVAGAAHLGASHMSAVAGLVAFALYAALQ